MSSGVPLRVLVEALGALDACRMLRMPVDGHHLGSAQGKAISASIGLRVYLQHHLESHIPVIHPEKPQ